MSRLEQMQQHLDRVLAGELSLGTAMPPGAEGPESLAFLCYITKRPNAPAKTFAELVQYLEEPPELVAAAVAAVQETLTKFSSTPADEN